MTRTLLFEVGTEELPPSELPAVLDALSENATHELGEARLPFETVRVYSTPRRLAVQVAGLADRQTARRITVTGPPKKAAFDAAGRPTRAADGFARSQGVTVDQRHPAMRVVARQQPRPRVQQLLVEAQPLRRQPVTETVGELEQALREFEAMPLEEIVHVMTVNGGPEKRRSSS